MSSTAIESHFLSLQIVILAESAGFHFGFKHQVHAALPTTDNEWAMTVAYCTNGCHAWYFWVILAWTILSINISILVYTIFSQKQFHADAMAAKSSWMVENAERSAQVERELNDFIAHEVRIYLRNTVALQEVDSLTLLFVG